ncbi:hypothetical protein Q3G72_012600 [Acer saccharum]|nr:hypothetical protein Q3G72_012600 [Acer saccharum]
MNSYCLDLNVGFVKGNGSFTGDIDTQSHTATRSRSADPSSYRDRWSDSRFGWALGYGSSVCSSSSKRDYDVAKPPRKLDLDGLTPFEKNFYVESPSVAAMSEKEVEGYRLQREITVEGRDVPKPVKSFSYVGFPEYVMQEIAKAGFVELTAIQAQGWPMALNGRDLIADFRQTSPGDGPILLVLSPTCELAVQILHESTEFGASSRIKVHASMVEFQRDLKSVISKKLFMLNHQHFWKIS